jgi:hypothetical protein
MTTTPSKPTSANEAKSPLALGKPAAAETKGVPEAKISLKAICTEMKLDPRIAREKLRIAVRDAKKFPELAKAHKPRSAWEWTKGSSAEKEARLALAV